MDQLFLENDQFEAQIEHFKLFDEVIRPIVELFYLQTKMQSVEIKLSTNLNDDRLVLMDKSRTQQVLINLLKNAIKVSP